MGEQLFFRQEIRPPGNRRADERRVGLGKVVGHHDERATRWDVLDPGHLPVGNDAKRATLQEVAEGVKKFHAWS